jgi:hypothetical protein
MLSVFLPCSILEKYTEIYVFSWVEQRLLWRVLQYYSTVDLVPHQYSGLVGVVAIGRMGTFAADGAQPRLLTLACHALHPWRGFHRHAPTPETCMDVCQDERSCVSSTTILALCRQHPGHRCGAAAVLQHLGRVKVGLLPG